IASNQLNRIQLAAHPKTPFALKVRHPQANAFKRLQTHHGEWTGPRYRDANVHAVTEMQVDYHKSEKGKSNGWKSLKRCEPYLPYAITRRRFCHRMWFGASSKMSCSAVSAVAGSTVTNSMPGLASTHHRAGSDVLRESGNASPDGYGGRIVFLRLRFPCSLHF